jgi:photosystem II stability/assembly factor-like uncharacterized protein
MPDDPAPPSPNINAPHREGRLTEPLGEAEALAAERMIELELDQSQGPAILVGTRKGAFCLTSNPERTRWQLSGPAFLGHIIHHLAQDPRDRRHLVAAARTGHLGPTVFRSQDMGRTWQEASRPPMFPKASAGETPRVVEQVFWISPGHADEPGSWYAGTSPEALFRSDDGGDTWQPVSGWNDHPRWAEWASGDQEGTPDGNPLHSVCIDPRDPAHMYLATSSGGVFESTDRGGDWRPLNGNVEANFLPGQEGHTPEFGQDTHCLAMHPQDPDVLYQQNHCGIYRLDRPGEVWERIGNAMPREVGDIGFPIALHPRRPDTAWVFPMDGSDVWPRTSPGGRPAVYVTRDGGKSWGRQDAGLPREQAWYTVKRQCMATDGREPLGVYWGTTSGEVWASNDEGGQWTQLAAHLPHIYSIEVAEVE